MDSFDNMMKAACHIKSYQLGQDKKAFERLPEFYKTGLYCWQMMENVHRQKDFYLKKCAFETHKTLGIDQLEKANFEDAHYSFCKALSIFKYIKSSNRKWKTDGGVKDEELEYVEDEGTNEEEKKEITQMKISALLNLSLCDLNSKKFDDVRKACDEVVKLDNKNVKAYYRKARSYLDCKASTLDDYILAQKDLQQAVEYDVSENVEMKSMLDNLNAYIAQQKCEERKVFKSFFRNVNYQIMQQEENQQSKTEVNKFTEVKDEDANSGKPQIRILNLILEICYNQIDLLERQGDRIEMNKMKTIAEKAKKYRDDLQNLLELDFDNPSDTLKSFATEHKLNLKDPRIKEHFLEVRKKSLMEINKFHEDNLLLLKDQNTKDKERLAELKKLKKKNKLNAEENKKKAQEDEEQKTASNEKKEKEKEKEFTRKKSPGKKYDLSPLMIGLVILIVMFVFYLIYDY